MENFDDYIRQGEPDKAEKAKVWKTAIGLQQVDGLQPSEYLIDSALQNIEGDITIYEVKNRIDHYYQEHRTKTAEDRTEEADKVSVRIAEILGEQAFTFSPAEYLTIHRRLFTDIYPFAGRIRDYNITKKEWVLNGETVLYTNADSVETTLEYDFTQEKKFSYRGLNQQEVVEHLAQFTASLWQIHPFGEGNTRTTAVFLIRYLRKLGFKTVDNELFANHSLYFRNALVRANYEDLSRGIYRTHQFINYLLSNLLFASNHSLKNRDLHILADTVNPQYDTVKPKHDTVNDTVFSLIQQNNKLTILEISHRLEISLSTVKRRIKYLKTSGCLERVGSDKSGYWKIIH